MVQLFEKEIEDKNTGYWHYLKFLEGCINIVLKNPCKM